MNKLYLICIDDQPEVLNALESDLSEFEEFLIIETCDSGNEAMELIDEIDAEGNFLAIVISDQVMPGLTGVEVLHQIEKDSRFRHTYKILLTGLATHEDTIEAINTGGLNYYIAKPWTKEHLSGTIKKCLTAFLTNSGIDFQPYIPILDQEMLYEILRKKT